MKRRKYVLTVGSIVAVAGCTGESSQKEQEESRTNDDNGDSVSDENETNNNVSPINKLPTTSFLKESHANGYSFEESSLTENNILESFGYLFKESKNNFGSSNEDLYTDSQNSKGIKYGITGSENGVIEVYTTPEGAKARIENLHEFFSGDMTTINGWGDWYIAESDINWDNPGYVYDKIIQPTRQIAYKRINNTVSVTGVEQDQFADPESVLMQSIEDRVNEYDSSGVDEDLLKLFWNYRNAEWNTILPDNEIASANDSFSIPMQDLNEESLKSLIEKEIGEIEHIYNRFSDESGASGQQDISSKYTADINIQDPNLDFIGENVETYLNQSPSSVNKIRLDISFTSFDSVELAVETFNNNALSKPQSISKNEGENRINLSSFLSAGIDDYGFYAEYMIGNLTFGSFTNRDMSFVQDGHRPRFIEREYISGNSIINLTIGICESNSCY